MSDESNSEEMRKGRLIKLIETERRLGENRANGQNQPHEQDQERLIQQESEQGERDDRGLIELDGGGIHFFDHTSHLTV